LHDALSAEKVGIPAAAVITDRFTQTARLIAQFNGMADYPFAVIAHPIADNSDDELRIKAVEALNQVARILIERPVADAPRATRTVRLRCSPP
jgi:hypothetical protein